MNALSLSHPTLLSNHAGARPSASVPHCTREIHEQILIDLDTVAVEREAQRNIKTVGAIVTLAATCAGWVALGAIGGIVAGTVTGGSFAALHNVSEKSEERALNDAHRLNQQYGCYRRLPD